MAAVCACMQVTSHPLLWTVLKFASMIGVVVAQAQLRRPALAFLRDHSIQGRIVLPAAAMLEMAMAFGKVALSFYISLPFAALYNQADKLCTGNMQGTHWLTGVFQCLLFMGTGALWHGKGVQ